MSAAEEVGRRKSLGDLLEELQPGGPCPWCGGELHRVVASRPGLIVGDVHPGVQSGAAVLWCSACGAEVHSCQCGVRPGEAKALGAAA